MFAVSYQAWENHLRRNRSIVVDLFHGQLRSQVKCKTCGHVSARFDPFNFLSLPLPMDNSMHLEIIGEIMTWLYQCSLWDCHNKTKPVWCTIRLTVWCIRCPDSTRLVLLNPVSVWVSHCSYKARWLNASEVWAQTQCGWEILWLEVSVKWIMPSETRTDPPGGDPFVLH